MCARWQIQTHLAPRPQFALHADEMERSLPRLIAEVNIAVQAQPTPAHQHLLPAPTTEVSPARCIYEALIRRSIHLRSHPRCYQRSPHCRFQLSTANLDVLWKLIQLSKFSGTSNTTMWVRMVHLLKCRTYHLCQVGSAAIYLATFGAHNQTAASLESVSECTVCRCRALQARYRSGILSPYRPGFGWSTASRPIF